MCAPSGLPSGNFPGCAVLNDCKYGVSTRRREDQPYPAEAPLVPDMHADQGLRNSYAFYAWNGSFAESRLPGSLQVDSPIMTAQGLRGREVAV